MFIKQKLLLQLTNKGFDKKIIEEVILSLSFENEDENLKKEIIKYIRKYPNDKYKVISKLAGKGYNINRKGYRRFFNRRLAQDFS